ncbi:MAG: AMP-binding protein [Clostridium sp.]
MEQSKQKLKGAIRKICTKDSHETAIIFSRESDDKEYYRFKDIMDYVLKLSNKLKEFNILKGDRVAIIGPNSPWWITSLYSILEIDATSVLIDASLPEDEINRLINKSDVSAIFINEEIYKKIDKLDIQDIPVFSLNEEFDTLNNVIGRSITKDPDEDVFAIIYSSGTTSTAKGVMITHKSILNSAFICMDKYNTGYRKRVLNIMPPFHIAGLTFFVACFLLGCETYIIEKPSPLKLSGAFLDYKPTSFGAVPKVYEVFIEKIDGKLAAKGKAVRGVMMGLIKASAYIRRRFNINIGRKLFKSINKQAFGGNIQEFFCGAAMIQKDTAEFYFGFGAEFYSMYGLTETNIPVTSTLPGEYAPGTNGKTVSDGMDIRIGDKDESGIGEILIKTPNIMKGYFRDEEITCSAFNEDGYFKTGDLGHLDSNGKLIITGRSKEIILLQTGKKVAPIDIEALYKDVKDVKDIACCGIGIKDKGYDEIHIFVVASNNNEEEIEKHLREKGALLPSHYRADSIHFVDEIPATSLGKVKRHLLKNIVIDNEAAVSIENDDNIKRGEVTIESRVIDLIYKTKKELISRGTSISLNSRLQEDLGFDSISMAELCFLVEGEYDIDLSRRIVHEMTVENVIDVARNNCPEEICEKKNYDINMYPAMRSWFENFIFKTTTGVFKIFWKFNVRGLENIPKDNGYIICPNHETHLDGMWVAGFLPKKHKEKYFCLAKEEHVKHSLGKFFIRILGGIPVNRTGNSAPALKKCREVLSKHNILLIHPEGTRTDNGEINIFKEGAAKLALDSDRKIIPVRIKGGYKVYPKGKLLPKIFNFRSFSRHKIEIVFGSPICPRGKTISEINTALKNQIVNI